MPATAPSPPAVPPVAVAAAMLWQRVLRFDPADPGWPDRDRFILSSGRFNNLLDWLLGLAGMAPPPPGCPHGRHPALETEPGPPGQGFATAVGEALGERVLAGRFGRTLVDHRTWVVACETDLAAGVALEAAELAGRMELDKLAVLFEPSAVERGGDGPDAATRFAAAGWAVRQVDAADPEAATAAIVRAQRNRRPTLIACLPDSGVPHAVPQDADSWATSAQRGAAARRGWLKRLARHRMAAEFDRQINGHLPPGWHRAMLAATDPDAARRETLGAARQDLLTLCTLLPETVSLHSVAGIAVAAAPPPASRTRPADETEPAHEADASPLIPPVAAESAPPAGAWFGGRQLFCGVQEHGMAAISNGLALHGGLRPILSASVVSIDRMRPALRLAALMERPVVYLLADQPPGNGAWPPVEQFASLRAMPHVFLFRPADPVELAACWRLALGRVDGPSLLSLSDRAALQRGAASANEASWRHDGCAQGGYVLAEAATRRRATLIATGPEVATALAARAILSRAGVETAVVSLPCWELFAGKPASYHAQVLGSAPRIGIEAASGFGWERWLGPDGVFIGMDGFGPGNRIGEHLGDQVGNNASPFAGRARNGPRWSDDRPASAGDEPAGITADCVSTRVLRLLGVGNGHNLNEE